MLPHDREGFWLTAKDMNGKPRALRFYETLDSLVRAERFDRDWYNTKHHLFREDYDDKVEEHHWGDGMGYLNDMFFGLVGTNFPYVVVDHREIIVPICELNRVAKGAPRRFRHWYRNRGRKPAYGNWRHPRTYQEKKAYYDALDQEEPVKVRSRRAAHLLPDLWDDNYAHAEKCWKRQSKRRHQWRAK